MTYHIGENEIKELIAYKYCVDIEAIKFQCGDDGCGNTWLYANITKPNKRPATREEIEAYWKYVDEVLNG